MKIAVFPGSFDPITVGHVDLVRRALPLFDKIIIAIGVNSQKKYLFSLEQRKNWLKDVFNDLGAVEIDVYESLTAKYPKLKTVVDYQNGNCLYISFFMRTLNFLPGDAVSLFLGAEKIPFGTYMAGGVLGTLPGVILATIFGANIKNPKSPAFWLSAVLLVMISVFSILIHRHISRKKK